MLISAFNIKQVRASAGSPEENTQTTDVDWWPTFQHDANRTGYTMSPGPSAGAVLWQVNLGYSITSSPVVADGMVYISVPNVGSDNS
jgi:hypothetical protein